MGSDHEAEIRASVGAHDELGPGYDDALAEGLVERIGAEIDKRIEAQLRRYGAPSPAYGPPGPAYGPPGPAYGPPGPAYGPQVSQVPPSPAPGEPAEPGLPRGYPAPSGYPPPGHLGYPGYPWYPGYPGPMLTPGYQAPPPATRPAAGPAGQRSVAMAVIALGSMTLGVAATAILAHAQDGGRAALVLLIWAAIAVVNIAYARRC